jgi:hypothetical protein
MHPSSQSNHQYNQINSNYPNTNTSKSPQSYNPFSHHLHSNQGFLSPQGGSFSSKQSVYASTIQPSTSSSNLTGQGGFGLGKL